MKRFRDFQLDSDNECIWQNGVRLSLSPKAYKILNFLVQNAGRTVTKEEFMEEIWPGIYVGEENLKIYVRELRRLLEDDAANPTYIETHRDRGYRFIAPVLDETIDGDTGSTQLFGRDNELRKLNETFAKACSGERQIVFISGEAGIGKTSLVETFLLQLREGRSFRIGIGQCIESYREQEPFYPVLEACGRLLTDPMGHEFGELLRHKAPTWFVQFPSIAEANFGLLQSEILGAGRERMLREICEALEVLTSQTPLVLLLEDLHWSDHSTLDFINAVARRREPARLLLIATYRPVEVIVSSHPLRSLKLELCIHSYACEVALEYLDISAVNSFLSHRFCSSIAAQLAPDIHRKTNGNPLFIVALVEHLTDQKMIVQRNDDWVLEGTAEQFITVVPNSLKGVIQKHIEQLSAEEVELLTVASVIGQSFSTAVLANALNANWTKIEERCDFLARRHLLLIRGGLLDLPNGQVAGLFQFTHALYREAIYNDCRPTARLHWHRRVGEAIEKIWPGQENETAAELARHFEESRDYERVVHYLLLQAENTEHRYAFQDAITLLELAAQIAEKLPASLRNKSHLEIQLYLARLYDKLGDKTKAAAIYGTVAEQAAAFKQWDIATNNLISQSRQIVYSDPPCALQIAERALGISHHASDSSRLLAGAWLSFLKLSWQGWSPRLKETLEDCVNQLRDLDDAGLAQLGAGLVTIQVLTGDHEGALRTSAEILPKLADKGDSFSHSSVRWMRSLALMKLGRFGESLKILQESLVVAERNSNSFDTAFGQMFTAELHLESLSPFTAASLCDQALSILSGSSIALQRGLIIGGNAYLECGDLDRADEYFSRIKTVYDDTNVLVAWYWKLLLHSGISELQLALGDIVSARNEVELLRQLGDATPNQIFKARAKQISSLIALAESNTARATDEITKALNIVENNNIPVVAWRVHETAAAVYEKTADSTLVTYHSQKREEILTKMAHSLDEDSHLRFSILAGVERSSD
ncbi:MAG TPA: AAA family ATPase [Pyrinomonadaceae bacterium]|nr:AAA family ATPase [Pyrinomonadaceae bacterium]